MQGKYDEREHFFAQFGKARMQFAGSLPHAWRPPTDVYETEGAVVVRMEIGGVQCQDIEVAVGDDQVLSVRGIRRDPRARERRGYHQMEIHYGVFQRSLYIPKPVHTERTQAHYDAGFLEIVLPIAERAVRPTRFVVTVTL